MDLSKQISCSQVWGDKDADGFYWGECRGRRGYVPHNMVVEVSEQEATGQVAKPRDRWTDAYANQPVRRMVALYDYDPQELSPNVDADVSLQKYYQIIFFLPSL